MQNYKRCKDAHTQTHTHMEHVICRPNHTSAAYTVAYEYLSRWQSHVFAFSCLWSTCVFLWPVWHAMWDTQSDCFVHTNIHVMHFMHTKYTCMIYVLYTTQHTAHTHTHTHTRTHAYNWMKEYTRVFSVFQGCPLFSVIRSPALRRYVPVPTRMPDLT